MNAEAKLLLQVVNIEVGSFRASFRAGCETCALSWEAADGSARFHIWMDPETFEDTGKFYKNPPLNLNLGDPGYFKMQAFSTTAKKHAPTIKAIKDEARRLGLVRDARLAIDQKRERDHLDPEESKRIARIKEAGPALLEAAQAALLILVEPAAIQAHKIAEARNILAPAIEAAKGGG